MKTNNLTHTITAHTANTDVYIKIRLNDECKNGHQDFAITADIYEKGKPKTERYHISSGCCHEEILKARPDLAIFVRLHLRDCKGIPMYAVENGFFLLRNGFNNTPATSPKFANEFCEFYRITSSQFDILNTCETKIQYAIKIQELGILEQWEKEANQAIKILEEFTGNEFVNDSKKTQFHAPTPEEIKDEKKKIASGYYSEKQKQERDEKAIQDKIQSWKDDAQQEIDKIKFELEIKLAMFEAGGEKAVENYIYYNHTKQIKFNWREYDKGLTPEEIETVKKNLVLPEGVTYKN